MKTMKISVVNRDPDFMASEIIHPYRTGSSICNLGFSPPSGKVERGFIPEVTLLAERFEHDE